MKSVEEEFKKFTDEVNHLCTHISVREDENGPYIFALGLKNTHSLQVRKLLSDYVLELWYGENAEVESIVEEPRYRDSRSAFNRARKWLERDTL